MPKKKPPLMSHVKTNQPTINLGVQRTVRLRLDQDEYVKKMMATYTGDQIKTLMEADKERFKYPFSLGRSRREPNKLTFPVIVRLALDDFFEKLNQENQEED